MTVPPEPDKLDPDGLDPMNLLPDVPDVPPDDRPNLVHFYLDDGGRLHRADPGRVWAAWCGTGGVRDWKPVPGADLTLLSVVRRGLEPVEVSALRLDLRKYKVTRASVERACREAREAGTLTRDAPRSDEIGRRSFGRLPANWDKQLAGLLDCGPDKITHLTIGGPLAISLNARMPVEDVVSHICEEPR